MLILGTDQELPLNIILKLLNINNLSKSGIQYSGVIVFVASGNVTPSSHPIIPKFINEEKYCYKITFCNTFLIDCLNCVVTVNISVSKFIP